MEIEIKEKIDTLEINKSCKQKLRKALLCYQLYFFR